MARTRFLLAIAVTGFAVLYQQVLHTTLFTVVGLGRSMKLLSAFPYTCRRIHDERLEACEDLWLDHENRQLYLICAGMQARTATQFDTGELNGSAIPPDSGWVSVMDIDEPGEDGKHGLRRLKKTGFSGYRGDGTVNPNGFGVERVDEKKLRFFVTDLEPVLDEKTGRPVREVSVEKRAAIQVFKHERGSDDIEFEYELVDEAIRLPNRVAVLYDGNIMVTNDHSHAGGIRRKLELFLGGGSIAWCLTTSRDCHDDDDPDGLLEGVASCRDGPPYCYTAVSAGLAMPNGLAAGPENLVYVPNCFSGSVHAYRPPGGCLPDTSLVDSFHHNYPLDNLAFDAVGDMWAPAISRISGYYETMADPFANSWHTTIWRFRRRRQGGWRRWIAWDGATTWTETKVLEDAEREVVAGVTTVEHDVSTGRLFMSGAYTPYMIVCEPR